MAKRKLPPSPAAPTLPASLDEEERRLFARELAGVRPLPAGPTRIPLARSARPRAHAAGRAASPAPGLTVERAGGRVTGASFGVSQAMLREIGRGALRAEATCDLHGLRVDAARLQLVRFVIGSAEHGRRVVLVICGRGAHSGSAGPVLLDLAITTLAEPPLAARVLAFVSAPPALGGDGALLVRLRGLRAARRG